MWMDLLEWFLCAILSILILYIVLKSLQRCSLHGGKNSNGDTDHCKWHQILYQQLKFASYSVIPALSLMIYHMRISTSIDKEIHAFFSIQIHSSSRDGCGSPISFTTTKTQFINIRRRRSQEFFFPPTSPPSSWIYLVSVLFLQSFSHNELTWIYSWDYSLVKLYSVGNSDTKKKKTTGKKLKKRVIFMWMCLSCV